MFTFNPFQGTFDNTQSLAILDNRYVNITGDTMSGQLVLGLAGTGLSVTQDSVMGGYLRVGSTSAPTNVTAGDLTAVRLKVVDGAFGTGVDFSVKGDGALSGFLRVGSETAPANTTAGDLTAVRLNLGVNTPFTANTGVQLYSIDSNIIPTTTTTISPAYLNYQVKPDDAATYNFSGLLNSVSIAPTANTAGRYFGMQFTVNHSAGAFNLTGASAMLAVTGIITQNVAATTVANMAAFRGTAVATAGTVTNMTIIDARQGQASDAGTIGTLKYFGNLQNVIPSGGITTAVVFSAAAVGGTGVGTAIGVDVAAQSGASTTSNIGIRIGLASGAGTNNWALQLSDTTGVAAGGITFGTDVQVYRSAANVLQTDDALIFRQTANILNSILVDGTVSTATLGARGLTVETIFTGAGAQPAGIASRPTFRPSSDLAIAYGLINLAIASPDTGITITDVYGGFYRVDTGSNGGAVTNSQAILAASATFGSTIPTNAYGLRVENQGPAAGTTTVAGIEVNAQVAGTTRTTGVRVNYPGAGNTTGAVTRCNAIELPTQSVILGNQTATTTNQLGIEIGIPTYTSTTNTRTLTNAAGLYIAGAPVASTNITITNGPFSAQIFGTTTLKNLAGSITRAIDVPAYTLTLANTTQITSVGPSAVGIGIVTINQSGGAVTVNSASSLYIAGPPTNGASVTLTSPYSIWVDAGVSRFDGGIAIDGATAVNVTSGVYTPTRSAEANLDSNVTMTEAQYIRVGSTVTVSGRFTADPTLTATTTSFEITLPVASNIDAVEDAAGTAFCGAIAGQGAEIIGSVANNTAVITWKAADITSQTWSYTFSYQVI